MIELIILIIALALTFDFLNGVNDAANAVATVVATKVLKPTNAVILSAIMNFVGAFIFTTAVASTIGRGIVNPSIVNEYVILSAVVGAIMWTYVNTSLGLPISVSHSLIGGLIGSALVAVGIGSLIFSGILKVMIFIVVAPVLGIIGGFLFTVIILRLFGKGTPSKLNFYFKKLQLISASFYALGHGTNDAQKTMGIIFATLIIAGFLIPTDKIPMWVILSSHAAIAFGTLIGGWKVVRTMGMRLTKIRPIEGFCAETSGGGILLFTALSGIPVSTTHVIAGSIMGVGSTKRLTAVRWGIARKIVWAWILTIPVSAILAGGVYLLISIFI